MAAKNIIQAHFCLSSGKLRLTIFPVKESKAHRRVDIPLCSPKAIQIVSDRFPGKHVLLLRADADYYLSTETEAAVIDWVATLKATMAQRAEGKTYGGVCY